MTATRRLAAILAADIAGYSRFMGLGEAGTAQALREHRSVADPLAAKHGGRIVKTTGDGVLIEFGSVVNAVECALAWQQLTAERNTGIADDRRMEAPHLPFKIPAGIASIGWKCVIPHLPGPDVRML